MPLITLGFAKENTKTENFKTTTTVVKKLSVEANNIGAVEKVENVKDICHKTIVTTTKRLVSSFDMFGNEHTLLETTITFTTYWYGC